MESPYCHTHKCKFYRNEKDGRVWYSHKIKGTDKYCNFQETKPQETGTVPAATVGQRPAPDRRPDPAANSIEAQVAFKGVVELTIAGKLKEDSAILKKAITWAERKLE